MHHSDITEAYVDGDMIKYEVGFAAEAFYRHICEEYGEFYSPEFTPWDTVERICEERIGNILAMLNLKEEDATMFFTGSYNFRFETSTLFEYKTRDSRKPYHHKNIEVYLKSRFKWIQEDSMEADDAMAIALTNNKEHGCIVSRDKDMWQVDGWHYSWELGKQPSRGPEFVSGIGYLTYDKSKNKLSGAGYLWFCAQLLMGDRTDSIPGIKGVGNSAAFKILYSSKNKEDALNHVITMYQKAYGNNWYEWLTQVGRCVYLCREKGELWLP